MGHCGGSWKVQEETKRLDRNNRGKMRGIFSKKRKKNSTASKPRQTKEGKLSMGNTSGDLLQEVFLIKGNLDS